MTTENHETLDEPTNPGFPLQPGEAPRVTAAVAEDTDEAEEKPKRKPRKKKDGD